VARAIFGIDKPGRRAASRSEGGGGWPAAALSAMRAGIGFVPEDRRQQGLCHGPLVARIATNERGWARLSRLGLIRRRREEGRAREWASRLQLKVHRGVVDPAGFLSGGNQQKVVLPSGSHRAEALISTSRPRHRRRHEVRRVHR
jgi:rhamnose transport system ATP-binding protein